MSEEQYRRVLEFLKPFAEGADGYLGFTRANRSDDPEQNKRWGAFENWYAECAAGEVDLPYEVLNEHPEWEYYFTPAVLTEESRLQSKFQHSNTIWIDFDNDVDWQSFSPPPSIVVQTSKHKFHCYWLTDWQITNANDMRYWCKRFLEYFSGGDVSGFDATQLLKLPWGLNLKLGAQNEDGTPWAPKVIKFAPDLKYPEAAFEHIPEPQSQLAAVVDMAALPDIPQTDSGWQFYVELHRSSISKALEEKVRTFQEGGEEKRSGVLYNLECELLSVLDNPEDVYCILLGSPNDKFTADYGPRGAQLLWKDVNRVAIKLQKSKATPKLSKALSLIFENKDLSSSQKVLDATSYVMDSLRDTGDFVRTVRGEAFYVDKRSEAISLHQVSIDRTSPFISMIRRRFGLNEGAHKSAITGILHETVDECSAEFPVKFHHFGHYDEERNRVYVDRYDGYMYVLDGEKIHLHPHGHDGVYFYQNGASEFPRTFEYVSDYEPGGLDAVIFDGPNFTTQGTNISRKELRHLLKTWVASFFFPSRMSTKPIVLIHGAADSGKTTLFQNLSVMFTGDSTYSVTEIPTDVKEFNVQVTQSSYIFYDNVEVNSKEMQTKLAQVATGYTVKNRVLFTNNQMVSEKARCFVGITSRTLDKIQDDVAQRYILIPVHPFRGGTASRTRRSMSEILKEVTGKRDALWSELLDFVNRMVKEIDEHGWPHSGSDMRMADYADILDITCGIVGLSSRKIEKFILDMQSEIVNENDPIFEAIKVLVDQEGFDAEHKYKGKELFDTLNRVNRKVGMVYKTSNKFVRQLKSFIYNGQLERAGIKAEEIVWGKNSVFTIDVAD
jgi:hypothetical protein